MPLPVGVPPFDLAVAAAYGQQQSAYAFWQAPAVAPAWNPATIYPAGAYVQFNGIIYKSLVSQLDWIHVAGTDVANIKGTSTPTITIPAVRNGDVLMGGCVMDTGVYLIGVTDNATPSNLYDITGADDSAVAVAGFKSRGPIAGSPTVLTLQCSGPSSGNSSVIIVVDEFAPPTGTIAVSLDGTTTYTWLNGVTSSAAFQTRHNDVLLYGFGWEGAGGAVGAGPGFSLGVNDTVNQVYSVYKIQSTPSNANTINFGANPGFIWGTGIGLAPVAADSWIPVQRRFVPTGAAVASQTLALPNKMSAGNIFVASASVHAGLGTITSIKDDLGNNYLSTLQSNVVQHCMFWSGGLLPGTPQSITINTSGSDQISIDLNEFAPPPGTTAVSFDQFVGNLGTSGASQPAFSAPALTTAGPHELIVSFCGSANGHSNPANMNCLNQNFVNTNSDAYIIQDAAGTFTAQWDCDLNSPVLAFAMSFLPAGAGGIPSPVPSPTQWQPMTYPIISGALLAADIAYYSAVVSAGIQFGVPTPAAVAALQRLKVVAPPAN